MKLKLFVLFFVALFTIPIFVSSHNANAQRLRLASNPALQNDTLYAKSSIATTGGLKISAIEKDKLDMPKYTSIPKPAGAPQIIENEEELDSLLALKTGNRSQH